MSEGETVGDEVREKAGSEILHVGSESHCEDFGCYSGYDGNPRKTESFIYCLLTFKFCELGIGFSI